MSKTGIPPLAVALVALFSGQVLAQEVQVSPSAVISVITTDWNDDGRMDRAVLYDGGEEDAALAIYLTGDDFQFGLAALNPNLVWFGSWGQIPSLSLTEDGALKVTSMNIGIGRNRWQMDLTIGFEGGDFVVTNYKYEDYDSLDLENYGTCEVNFSTGRGVVSRGEAPASEFKIKAQLKPLGVWSYEDVPQEC
jgi:hypothetical protein